MNNALGTHIVTQPLTLASFVSSWEEILEGLHGLSSESFGHDPLLSVLVLLSSLLVAAFPMLTFLGLMWWLDRYNREPLWLLGLTFLWGALIATTMSFMGNTILGQALTETRWFHNQIDGFLQVALLAPLVEEPFKAAIFILLIRSRHLNTMTDGFVYGAAAGLGFGSRGNDRREEQ